MFSGIRKLGEAQDVDEIRQDKDEKDIDFIATNYLSPDGGYPHQRISNYDEQLVQHQTLNGVGMSRTAAPFMRNFLMHSIGPRARLRTGSPRSTVDQTPRFKHLGFRGFVAQ